MEIERIRKPSFCVMGVEGSTEDGEGFIQRLWAEANRRFAEIAPHVMRDERGNPLGFWGAMSDVSRAFRPWTDGFSKGLYLAGAQTEPDAKAPEGMTVWRLPGFVYLRVRVQGDMTDTFQTVINHMRAKDIKLVGAVQDYIDPATGQPYQYFPIARL